MPPIVTPRRLNQTSEFYHQLGTMLAAGVPMLQVLEHLLAGPPGRSFREPLRQSIRAIGQGATFHEAVSAIPDWLPPFDLALIEAGEKSGRLDVCSHLLSAYYSERARLVRSTISDLAYPAFILLFAIMIFPPNLLARLVWNGEVVPFVLAKLSVLLPLAAVVFFVVYSLQGSRGEEWRAFMERLLHWVPLVGKARRMLALARLAAALEALLNAGVSVVQGWEIASRASGSPALTRKVASWRPRLDAGATPAEMLRLSPEFPEVFANLYQTGEISGTQDTTLRRLHQIYQDDASRKLKAAAEWAPRLIYILILLGVAYFIVRFWINYYGEAFKALG